MPNQDVVGVFDSNNNELFVGANAVKATVTPRAKIPKHPLETGATISDHIIFDPIEIELSVILDPEDYQDIYQQIKNTFLTGTLVTIVTKTDSYPSMAFNGIPYDETPDMFDTIAMGLKLSQFDFVTPQYGALPPSSVKKASNASTSQVGQKNTTPATPAQQSTLIGILQDGGITF